MGDKFTMPRLLLALALLVCALCITDGLLLGKRISKSTNKTKTKAEKAPESAVQAHLSEGQVARSQDVLATEVNKVGGQEWDHGYPASADQPVDTTGRYNKAKDGTIPVAPPNPESQVVDQQRAAGGWVPKGAAERPDAPAKANQRSPTVNPGQLASKWQTGASNAGYPSHTWFENRGNEGYSHAKLILDQ